MKKNSVKMLTLKKSTVQNLSEQIQTQVKGGITGACGTRPRTTITVSFDDVCPQTFGDYSCDYTCTSVGGTIQFCCL
jgi:hypothetical protein